MLQFIKDIDAEDVGLTALMAVLTLIVILFGASIFQSHGPKNYYLGQLYEGRCAVYANNPWEGDDKVFHSADINECLKTINNLNQGLK